MREGMKDIFTELYNKVMGFFSQQNSPDRTKSIAVNRLKTILMQDRAGFSERSLQMMKDEMLDCISKYMDIDEENLELQIDADENAAVLKLNIPVTRAHTDEEVDEILKKKEEHAQIKAEEIVMELEDLIEERAKALIEKREEENNSEENEDKENESNLEVKENKTEETTETNPEQSEENKEISQETTETNPEQSEENKELSQEELNTEFVENKEEMQDKTKSAKAKKENK